MSLSYSDQREAASKKALSPRWLYDCGHCRMFACGPECACAFNLKPGPASWFAVKIGTHPKTVAEVRAVKGHDWREMTSKDHRPMPLVGSRVEFRESGAQEWQDGIVDRILDYEGLGISHA